MRRFILKRLPAFNSKAERAALFLAFGLSLSLFGLTTLEALPLSTQTALWNQSTIALTYWVSLWLLSILILFVVPSLVGASVATSFGHFLCCTSSPIKSDSKKYTIFDSRNLPWCIRVVGRLIFGLAVIVVKNVLYKGYSWCCSSRRRQNPIDSSVLPLREDSIARSISGEIRDDSSHRSKNRSVADSSSSTNKKYDFRQRFFAAIGAFCGIILVLGLFGTLGPLAVQLPSAKKASILSLIVSWLCGVGLLISSVLNGFGSVSLPYTTLSGFFLERIRPEYMTKLESNLKNMRKILIDKQNTLKELKVQIPTLNASRSMNQSSVSSGKTFSMSSLLAQNNANYGFSDLGGDLKKRRQMLTTEIAFMEDLVRETSLDLQELKHSQMTAAAARTSIGKAKLYVGLVFSSILLIRLFNAGYSIFRSHGTLLKMNYDPPLHKKSRSDVVTSILIRLTGHHHFSHNQFNMLSQVISLVLSAVLSFTQLRIFLRTATTVHRRFSRLYKTFFCAGENANRVGLSSENHSDQKSKENLLWWIISALLGCYSLACTVSIKMLLPEKFSVAFSMALDETRIFSIRSSAVDMVFLSSAVISSAILGMLLGIQRQNISKHANILSSKRGSNVAMASLLVLDV